MDSNLGGNSACEGGDHHPAAIEKLDTDCRIVFVPRDIERLSTEETAKLLSLSIPAVKIQVVTGAVVPAAAAQPLLRYGVKRVKCKDVIIELSAYLDGELDEKLAAEVRRHMEHCEHCRVMVDTTRHIISLFCGTEPAELPRDVHDRLHQALERRLRTAPSW